MSLERVDRLDALWDGEMRGYVVGGRKVLLVRLEGRVFAYEDRCSHLGVALSAGRLDAAYQYDARTGSGINPRSACLRAFSVAVEDGWVAVDVDVEARLPA